MVTKLQMPKFKDIDLLSNDIDNPTIKTIVK